MGTDSRKSRGALIDTLTLPILPLDRYATLLLSAAVPDTANEVGWPQFVSTVEGVVASLPADERAHAVILTNAYSEASPLILLGTGLPPIFSVHNSYWSCGPPPDDRTVVVHVGDWRPADWSQFFVGCRDLAHIDNRLGIQNGEQGTASTASRDEPSECGTGTRVGRTGAHELHGRSA